MIQPRADVAAHAQRAELLRLIGSLRRRLARELLLRRVLQALSLALAALALALLAAWLARQPLPPSLALLLLTLPLLLGLALAAVGWPSRRRAALEADRRLGLDERLATALELAADRRATRLGPLQVDDALQAARLARRRWPAASRLLRRELATTLGLGCLATAAGLLVQLGDALPLSPPTLAALVGGPEPTTPNSALAAGPNAASLTGVGAQAFSPQPPNTAQIQDALAQLQRDQADLQQRANATRLERQALDRLAQALGDSSAGRPAAESLQRGDYAQAASQIADLGTQADQLSPAAKRQLAGALRQSAQDSSASPALAERERQAAAALAGTDYEQQYASLQGLGEEVARAGSRVVPHGELVGELARVQQQERALGQSVAPASAANAAPGQRQPLAGASSSADTQGGQAAAGAGDGRGDQPQQAGEANGGTAQAPQGDEQSSGKEVAADQASGAVPSLAAAGQSVEVPLKAGTNGSGRAGGGDQGQQLVQEGAAASSDAAITAPGAPELVRPEQNLVPGDRRQVVRDYFSEDGQR